VLRCGRHDGKVPPVVTGRNAGRPKLTLAYVAPSDGNLPASTG